MLLWEGMTSTTSWEGGSGTLPRWPHLILLQTSVARNLCTGGLLRTACAFTHLERPYLLTCTRLYTATSLRAGMHIPLTWRRAHTGRRPTLSQLGCDLPNLSVLTSY